MDRLQTDERRRTHLPTPFIHPDRSPGPFIPDLLRPRAAPICCRVEGADRIVCDLAEALLEVRMGWKPIEGLRTSCGRLCRTGRKTNRARARVRGEVSSKKGVDGSGDIVGADRVGRWPVCRFRDRGVTRPRSFRTLGFRVDQSPAIGSEQSRGSAKLTAGDGADDEQRLGAGGDGLGQRGVG